MANNEERMGFTFIWKIENFNYCLEKTGDKINGPVFVAENLGKTEWRLNLFPRGEKEDNYISLYLERYSVSDESGVDVIDFEFTIHDGEGYPLLKKMDIKNEYQGNMRKGFTKFVSRDEMFGLLRNKYLPHDILTVRCRIWKTGTKLEKNGLTFARTQVGIEKKSFMWIVKEFSSLQRQVRKEVCLEPLSKLPPLVFALFEDCDGNIEIEIRQVTGDLSSFSTFKVSAINAVGKVITTTETKRWFKSDTGEQVCKLTPFITRSKLMSNKDFYLPEDALYLNCEYTTSVGVISNQIEDCELFSKGNVIAKSMNNLQNFVVEEKVSSPPSSLKKDLQTLYEERKFCDIILQSDGLAFPVHKAILCARSPVFCAMFENDMQEKSSNTVDIPDVNASTMRRMLNFLYSDSVDDMQWESALKLYFAADKYGIASLKQTCSSYLKASISSKNICDVFILADRHQDEELKATAHDYFLNYSSEVMASEEWKSFERNNLQLAFEALRLVVLKNSEK